jgi:hypothetical protein
MTDTVVVQSNDTAVVQSQTINQVVTEEKGTTVILTGMMGPPNVASISNSGDVDSTDLQNGSMLVYNTVTNKWVATRLLDQQTIEAGQF